MQPVGILETVLYARDLDATEVFYRDILGMEAFSKSTGRSLFYRCGNQVLLFFNPEITRQQSNPGGLPIPPHGAAGDGHVCFRASAAGIGAWKEKLETAGITIEADFEWPGGGRSIYFRDPANNCLEFAEPKLWGLE